MNKPPEKKPRTDGQLVEKLVKEVRGAFIGMIGTSDEAKIEWRKEAEFAVQQITKSDYSMRIALQHPQSVREAVTNIAGIGISLNPARKQAYLVPRKNGIYLEISYIGMLDIAMESGSIRWGQALLVHDKDTFKRRGIDKEPLHEFDEFSTDRGNVVGVYVCVKTIDGDYLTTTMTAKEVVDIRDRSESWKAYVAGTANNSPWNSDQGEMTKKTVIRRGSKMWPKTERMNKMIAHLDNGGDGIDFEGERATPKLPPPPLPGGMTLDGLIKLGQETKTDALALKFWQDNFRVFAKDREGYEAFKAAMSVHRASLGAVPDKKVA